MGLKSCATTTWLLKSLYSCWYFGCSFTTVTEIHCTTHSTDGCKSLPPWMVRSWREVVQLIRLVITRWLRCVFIVHGGMVEWWHELYLWLEIWSQCTCNQKDKRIQRTAIPKDTGLELRDPKKSGFSCHHQLQHWSLNRKKEHTGLYYEMHTYICIFIHKVLNTSFSVGILLIAHMISGLTLWSLTTNSWFFFPGEDHLLLMGLFIGFIPSWCHFHRSFISGISSCFRFSSFVK